MPPLEPQLTVALPVYNGANSLRPAIQSILEQDLAPFDLIVCDDRSTDDSLAVIRQLAGDRARIVENPERLGLAKNWNRCVEVARTPFVAIFHQDDVMKAGHLAAHARVFARDPDLGWVASASGVIDENGQPVPENVVGRGGLGPSDRIFNAGEALPAMAIENPLRCSAVTLSAAAHAEAGGFDPSFRYVVDWEFWIRVAQRRRVGWIASPTVDVRWHLASETHRFATGTSDLEETSRLLDSLPIARHLRQKADQRLARAYLNRAHVALKAGNSELGQRALRKSVSLWPGIVGRIAIDPRLAVQMASLSVWPGWAARTFGP